MKCDELKYYCAYRGEVIDINCDEYKDNPKYDTFYIKADVDEAIAELKEFAEDACLERDDNQTAIDELQAENAELKKKLEDEQASMYADVVDVNMDNRRLKEECRWRKFSDEKPEHHQWILVFYPNHSQFTTGVELRRWDDGCKYDVEIQEIYEKWMPLPEPPKEDYK